MSTARNLIEGSLRLVGALSQGESASASEMSDALSALNMMLSSWSNESLLIYTKAREEFPLVAGTDSYTMGDGATFDTARPTRIENAAIEISGSDPQEFPIDIITRDEYAKIGDKATQSSLPTKLYPSNTYPNETLFLWPVPSAAHNLVLYSWKPLVQFTDASDTISLPDGYERAIKYNLAVEIGPEYGRPTPAEVSAIAMESKAAIKRMNVKPLYLGCDQATLSRVKGFDYRIGE